MPLYISYSFKEYYETRVAAIWDLKRTFQSSFPHFFFSSTQCFSKHFLVSPFFLSAGKYLLTLVPCASDDSLQEMLPSTSYESEQKTKSLGHLSLGLLKPLGLVMWLYLGHSACMLHSALGYIAGKTAEPWLGANFISWAYTMASSCPPPGLQMGFTLTHWTVQLLIWMNSSNQGIFWLFANI